MSALSRHNTCKDEHEHSRTISSALHFSKTVSNIAAYTKNAESGMSMRSVVRKVWFASNAVVPSNRPFHRVNNDLISFVKPRLEKPQPSNDAIHTSISLD